MRIIRICFAKDITELKNIKEYYIQFVLFFIIIYKGGAYKAYTLMIFSMTSLLLNNTSCSPKQKSTIVLLYKMMILIKRSENKTIKMCILYPFCEVRSLSA